MAVGLLLAYAGVRKAADPSWVVAARRFGSPAPLARVLPAVEIGLGALLVAGLGLPWTAWAALVLLTGFTAAIAVRLARHDPVPCACFGSAATAAPVSGRAIVRNLTLIGLAALAAAG